MPFTLIFTPDGDAVLASVNEIQRGSRARKLVRRGPCRLLTGAMSSRLSVRVCSWLVVILLMPSRCDALATAEIVRVAEAAGRAASAVVRNRLGADVIKSKASRGDLLTEVDGQVQELIQEHVQSVFPTHAFLGEETVPAGAKASAEALNAVMAASSAEFLWIVDPIDGTTNFVQSLPLVGISIGVARRTAAAGSWEMVAGAIIDPFKDEVFTACKGGGAFLNGAPICVGSEPLADAVVATGFAPNEASLRPMVRGIAAVGARARTVRMLGSAAIMLAWVACGRLSCYFEADLNAWDTAAGVLLVREAGGVVTDLRGDAFEVATRPLLASNRAAHVELQATLAEVGVVGLDSDD